MQCNALSLHCVWLVVRVGGLESWQGLECCSHSRDDGVSGHVHLEPTSVVHLVWSRQTRTSTSHSTLVSTALRTIRSGVGFAAALLPEAPRTCLRVSSCRRRSTCQHCSPRLSRDRQSRWQSSACPKQAGTREGGGGGKVYMSGQVKPGRRQWQLSCCHPGGCHTLALVRSSASVPVAFMTCTSTRRFWTGWMSLPMI